MTPEKIKETLEITVRYYTQKKDEEHLIEKHLIEKHLKHIDFALYLVDDIDDYDDAMFIHYSKIIERMKNE